MISVKGGSGKNKQIILDAACFAYQYLIPRIRKCDINITCKTLSDDEWGYAWEYDDREFKVEINKDLEGDDLLTTVFHEMVHVKQHVRGEWCDEGYRYKTHDEYINLPWEKEAVQLQEVILAEWKKR